MADTVGGPGFWDLVGRGRAPGYNVPAGWQARAIAPAGDVAATLRYEAVNVPLVMTPWELREHLGFLLRDLPEFPNLQAVHQQAARFQTLWQALWSEHGPERAGWPGYRAAIDAFDAAMEQLAKGVLLVNGSVFLSALRAMILSVALGDRRAATAEEPRLPAGAAAPMA